MNFDKLHNDKGYTIVQYKKVLKLIKSYPKKRICDITRLTGINHNAVRKIKEFIKKNKIK